MKCPNTFRINIFVLNHVFAIFEITLKTKRSEMPLVESLSLTDVSPLYIFHSVILSIDEALH